MSVTHQGSGIGLDNHLAGTSCRGRTLDNSTIDLEVLHREVRAPQVARFTTIFDWHPACPKRRIDYSTFGLHEGLYHARVTRTC